MGNINEAFTSKGFQSSQRNNYSEQNRGRDTKQNSQSQPQSRKTIEAIEIPKDYVEKADEVMFGLSKPNKYNEGKRDFDLTTSKIRNILSLVSDIYNQEMLNPEEELSESSLEKIEMMRVRILYEAGREENIVKPFVVQSKILNYLKSVRNNKKKFINFARYMEALVAYHRYYGGK